MYKFFKWFYKWWFFEWTFQRQCFQKICTNFSKEKICTKDVFNDFQMFQNLCTKEHFQWFLPMFIQKVCTKIFWTIYFLCTLKKKFQWFFFLFKYICTKNLKDLKNMCKLQSENMFKSFFSKVCAKCFSFIFFKISLCRIRNSW